MQLYKAHGLGNDYLVLESGPVLNERLVKQVCDRHIGIGGDGMLEPTEGPEGTQGVKIWNADGSIAEKSGNGLRIYGWYLVHKRGKKPDMVIHTGFEKVPCQVEGDNVSLHMGRPRFSPAEVPVNHSKPLISYPVELGNDTVEITAVGMGNPHCVVFVDQPFSAVPWRKWGEQLCGHTLFPNKTNVQIVRVTSPTQLDIRIWERGVGVTQASGTSACAAVAAAIATGRAEGEDFYVNMEGGTLRVLRGRTGGLILSGPVEGVGEIHIEETYLETYSAT